MNRIARQTVVLYGDRLGVTVDDFAPPVDVCLPDETPVVFYGSSQMHGVATRDLVIIGPDPARAGFTACGAGHGALCCKYLIAGPGGPECGRFGALRWAIIFKRDMVAQRDPTAPYPQCQLIPSGK